MARKADQGCSKELPEQWLAARVPKTMRDSGGLPEALRKALAKRMLNVEMGLHLEHEADGGISNHRNGSSATKALTRDGPLELPIPRDRTTGSIRR